MNLDAPVVYRMASIVPVTEEMLLDIEAIREPIREWMRQVELAGRGFLGLVRCARCRRSVRCVEAVSIWGVWNLYGPTCVRRIRDQVGRDFWWPM